MVAKQDLTNKRFGKLTALKAIKVDNKHCWLCRCDCGNEVVRDTYRLNSTKNNHCGCERNKKIGDVFGDLTIVEIVEHQKYGIRGNIFKYKCSCKCGGERVLFSTSLNKGKVTHCGCKTPESRSAASRGEFGVGIQNMVIRGYQRNAKDRGLSFNLSRDEILKLLSGNCFYCGDEPSRVVRVKKMYGEFIRNGIDRLDSSKGYESGNVVSCCTTCNFLKSDYTYNEFLQIIKKIADNLKL